MKEENESPEIAEKKYQVLESGEGGEYDRK